ncbi:SapC family protein [Allosphingosinicella indica]|uniref:SapC protein n=1 Tax=Allosphingosinicella indica TaxID=941907 RepID=A0A1X7FZC5_9SPHN|nr:SapC family protein [Allosphingosinicella indica]SMF61470.1 SapC protein [Allosphingosinicella indica]
MASEPPRLPLFYKGLEPLSSQVHANYRTRAADTAPFLTNAHAIPITVDEFVTAQRFYPIVFSAGENPVPIVLMGLNDGVNVFVDEDGRLKQQDIYVPAYVRRYPFMLAKLRPDVDELSLCFDPESGLVGPYDEGLPLFEDGKPSMATDTVLKFCEEFETSAQRTNAFMEDLVESGLLIDGEVTIQPTGSPEPFIYRGFQMVSEEKVRDLRGDELRKMNQKGLLPLVMAHLFSLGQIREIFGKQMGLEKVVRPVINDEAETVLN